jgi:hypothetical protein
LLRDAQHLNYFNTRRYSKVASYVHWMVWKHMGLQGTENYYEQIYMKVS